MGSKASDRRSRSREFRVEQARSERRSRMFFIGGVALVVLLISSGVTWALVSKSSATGGTASIKGLKTYAGLSRDHTDAPVAYAQNPPVGGAHSPVWQNCGWYDTPVADVNAVHTLEHSAVWVTYSPDLSAADRAELKGELSGKDYVLASPYAGLPGSVVATAWGAQVVLDGVSDPRLLQFVDAFAGAPSAPEPLGECTGGVGSPS